MGSLGTKWTTESGFVDVTEALLYKKNSWYLNSQLSINQTAQQYQFYFWYNETEGQQLVPKYSGALSASYTLGNLNTFALNGTYQDVQSNVDWIVDSELAYLITQNIQFQAP